MKALPRRPFRPFGPLGLASSHIAIGILSLIIAIGTAAAAGTASSSSSHEYLARPIHFFSFVNQSLADKIGPGLLRAELGGSVTTTSASSNASVYTFEPNGGPTVIDLQLADGGEYTIELSIRLDDPLNDGEGTIKALDFVDLQNDYGVYVIDGRLGYIAAGGIQSSPSSSPTDIEAGVPTHITITRRSDTRNVSFFTKGIDALSMLDSSNDFVIGGDDGDGSLQSPPPPLRLFQDDTNDFCSMVGRPPRCDSGSGSIEYIKVYDTALTSDDIAVLHVQGKDELEVVACLCDSANGICVDDDTVPQLVSICLRCDQDGFVVASVNDFWYEQGGTVQLAVQNGTEQVATVISPRDGYTMISTILSDQFYSANISPIVGKGSVDLAINPTLEGEGQRRLQASQIRIAAIFRIVLGRSANVPSFRPTSQSIGSLTPSSTPSAFVATRPPHLLEPTDRDPAKRRKGGLVVNLIVSGTSILVFGSVACGVWKVGRYVMAMRRQRSEAVA